MVKFILQHGTCIFTAILFWGILLPTQPLNVNFHDRYITFDDLFPNGTLYQAIQLIQCMEVMKFLFVGKIVFGPKFLNESQ